MSRFFALSLLYVLIISGISFSAEIQPPSENGTLPEITLSLPQNRETQEYLGLEGKAAFMIPQIKAEAVIIEIFSMYCPHCQREAPAVNRLYEQIEKDGNLKNKVKMIAIGAGNSDFEVKVFRETYHIRFPLFPDGDYSIHKKIGQVRTPHFIAISIRKDGTHSVFYSKTGAIEDADRFLKLISAHLQGNR